MSATQGVLPRILVITDSSPGPHAFGSARTLGNLFSLYPRELLRFTVFPSTSRVSSSDYPAVCIPQGERLKRISPYLYHSLVANLLPGVNLEVSHPQLIFVTASRLDTYLYANRIARLRGIPILPFFMDDLRSDDTAKYCSLGSPVSFSPRFSFSGFDFFRSLLEHAAGVCCISDALFQTISKRYNSAPQRMMIVHNPVPLSFFPPALPQDTREDGLSLVYAGSIWGMHRDALTLCVEAVHSLNVGGTKVLLSVYAPPEQIPQEWYNRSGILIRPPVAYDELGETLAEGDLLLLCSAFDDSQRYLVETSLQTKVTDYLAAGRPILAVGPGTSASSTFVRINRSGYALDTPTSQAVLEGLESLTKTKDEFPAIGTHNRRLATDRYSAETVIPRFFSFLRECIP